VLKWPPRSIFTQTEIKCFKLSNQLDVDDEHNIMRCLYRGQVDDDDDVQCFWSWGHVYIYFWGLKSEVYIPNILDGHHQRDCIWIQQTVKQIDLIKSNLSENLLYHTIQLTIPDW